MTALEYFRLLVPEFAGVSDGTVNSWLAMAGNLIDVSCLDTERAAMATALYAAHMLALSQRGGAFTSGSVTSEKEGDLSRSYGAVAGHDTWLGQTSYGLQYMDMTSGCYGASIMTRIA